jgi:transposase
MMTERKNEAAHDRLYKHGKDKLRTLAIEQNTKTIQHLEQKKGPDSPPRDKADLHRGKDALYQLHQQKLERNERAREELLQKEALDFKKQTFKNTKSEELRIQGFKKEFRLKLAEVVKLSDDNVYQAMPNPKDNVLEFGQVT